MCHQIKSPQRRFFNCGGMILPTFACSRSNTLLSNFLQKLSNEYIVLGDLNWDWLLTSLVLRDLFDVLHLKQLVQSPTCQNPKRMDKSTLIDVILTNASHK